MAEKKSDWYLELSPDEEIEQVKATLELHSKRPPNNDERIAVGSATELESFYLFEEIYRESFADRRQRGRPINPNLLPNLFDRGIWKQADLIDSKNWPKAYDHARRYRKLFWAILNDPDGDMTGFRADARDREIMSNPTSRSRALKATMLLMPELFGHRPNLLDIGASANHWLAALEVAAQGTDLDLGDIEIVNFENDSAVVDDKMTSTLRDLMRIRPAIGISYGVDEWDWENDEATRDWARYCTLLPSELMPEYRMYRLRRAIGHAALGKGRYVSPLEQYEMLDNVNSPRLKFERLDATNRDEMRRFAERADIPLFNGVNMATVNQQQTQENRDKLERVAIDMRAKDYSPVMVHDFCWPDPKDPTKLIYADDIYASKWLYRSNILTDEGWKSVFIWETGRCYRAQAPTETITVGGKVINIKDRLSGKESYNPGLLAA